MYMLSFNESQLMVMGWVLTVGVSVITTCVVLLVMYCLYSLYKVVRNFGNKY